MRVFKAARKWAGIVGGTGFVLGFFGPLVFMTESNLGPITGILFTGPLGAVLGFVGGALGAAFGGTAERR